MGSRGRGDGAGQGCIGPSEMHQRERQEQKQAVNPRQTGLGSDFICLQKVPSESLLESEI